MKAIAKIYADRNRAGYPTLSGSLPASASRDLHGQRLTVGGWSVTVKDWRGKRLYLNGYKGRARWTAYLTQSWLEMPGYCDSPGADFWRLTAIETPSEQFALLLAAQLNAA